MKYLLSTVLILLCTTTMCFAVTLHSMSKLQIEAAFFNKTYISIPVDNLDGKTVNDSNTIYLDGKGVVVGEMGIKPKHEPKIATGSYTISKDGAVYIQWKHWDFKKRLCFHLYETNNAYVSIDCHNVFHSVFMKSARQLGNHIN